jgi:hypothetical protein
MNGLFAQSAARHDDRAFSRMRDSLFLAEEEGRGYLNDWNVCNVSNATAALAFEIGAESVVDGFESR